MLRTTSKADFWLPPLLFYREAFGTSQIVPFLKKLENKFMAGWVMKETPSTRSEAMNRVLREMDKIKRDPALTDDQRRQAVISLPALDFDVNRVMQRLSDEAVYGQPYANYVLYKMDLILAARTPSYNRRTICRWNMFSLRTQPRTAFGARTLHLKTGWNGQTALATWY